MISGLYFTVSVRQSDVKAGLDHDVSLGVLEPVPVGEPVA